MMRIPSQFVACVEPGRSQRWLGLLQGLRKRKAVAVIFDLDGVVTNTMPYHVQAWRSAFASVGVAPSDIDLYLREGEDPSCTARDLFALHRAQEPTTPELQSIVRAKNKIYAETVRVRLFPGATTLLRSLQDRGVRLGLVTGTIDAGVILRSHPALIEVFEIVVSGKDVSRFKPDPQPYQTAIMKLRLPAQRCFVIENSPYGIRSARSAGLACAVVRANSPLSRKFFLQCGADYVYSSLLQLGRHIEAGTVSPPKLPLNHR